MKFSVNMRNIIFVVCFLVFQMVQAQEFVILDAENKEPIPNVAIYNNDKSKTVISDLFGKADLGIFSANERIIFKHIGYQLKKTSKTILSKRENKRVYLTMNAEQLDEVVMSISKWEQQRKDIPQKITSIDAKTIAFTSPQTSADLLQNSGKVFVQKSQLGGGSPMIRGFATNRLLITVDGIRMNNAIFRGGNIQNIISIDPFTIKNTEVIFGPGSVIYGSDAIGGVMNFYTQTPQLAIGDSLRIKGNMDYRYSSANNENTWHADLNYGKRKWGLLTSVSYSDFGDLKMGKNGPESYLRNNYVIPSETGDQFVVNPNPRKQVPSGYDQINAMQKVTYKPNNFWDLDMGLFYSETSDYSRYDRLIRPNRAGDGLRSAEWYYGPQKWFMANLQAEQKGKGKFYDGLKITNAYQHFQESRNERGFQDPILYSTAEKVDALSSNIDFENKRMGDFRLYYGGEYVFNKINSEGSQKDIETNEVTGSASRYPDGSTWQTLAGYFNVEYKLKPNMTILTGLRYSHVWINADFDTTYYSFPFQEAKLSTGALTGSLGLSWLPKPDLQVTWNGSTGFRAPNIDDIGKIFDSEPGAVIVPNPDLQPEYAYNMEVGIQKNFKDKLVLKGAAFYTYLVDALVRRDYQFNGQDEIEYNGETSRVQAIQNAAKAYVYGIEFGMEAFFTENLSMQSNLTITEGIEEEEDGTDSPGRHVAPTFGDVHVIWKNQRFKADLFLAYNGEISNDNLAASEIGKAFIYELDANGNPYSPSWYTLNVRSQYELSSSLKLTASLENITNQRYRPYSSGITAAGTNLILGVGYHF
ncbi:TonB-dependent receptor [Sediminicola sp. YIK13]|uniref:TonB-dependent receptor plug domain-containing protein n=1 Tax=Sediminicola sp. YIK13 TaxID=1453352 RepID=UPI00071F2F7C|nr:TonB-dependent receptor [Sediminicola sp. YIK13]ALM08643.1 TonB-dependent receptor [Sediminicola sp. YIK13]